MNALLAGLVAALVVFTTVLVVGTLVVRWNACRRRRRRIKKLRRLRTGGKPRPVLLRPPTVPPGDTGGRTGRATKQAVE